MIETLIITFSIFVIYILYVVISELKRGSSTINWQLETICKKVDQHILVLARKRRQGCVTDDYGNIDNVKWKKEVFYFVNKIREVPNNGIYLSGDVLFTIIDKRVKEYQENNNTITSYNDSISPIGYEEFCADILNNSGWSTRMTQATGDQGVDVIATKDDKTVAIQCKKYSSPVGNKAVQEIHAGMRFIDARYGVVVTNASYTPSAKQLAKSLKVFLLHHDDLESLELILDIPIE